MGNTAVLGACVRLLLPEGIELLEQAIASRMGPLAGANVLAARAGYERCTRQRRLAGDRAVESASAPGPTRRRPALFPISLTDSLANHTGTWSIERPVLTAECTACALCALFCPEGVITRSDGSMAIDYDYCKGCGICEVVCPVKNAITMELV